MCWGWQTNKGNALEWRIFFLKVTVEKRLRFSATVAANSLRANSFKHLHLVRKNSENCFPRLPRKSVLRGVWGKEMSQVLLNLETLWLGTNWLTGIDGLPERFPQAGLGGLVSLLQDGWPGNASALHRLAYRWVREPQILPCLGFSWPLIFQAIWWLRLFCLFVCFEFPAYYILTLWRKRLNTFSLKLSQTGEM